MAQTKVITWTNPASAVAKNVDCGFDPAEAYIVDLTNGDAWYWNSGFTNAYYQTVSTGAITTSNGVTPLAQGALFGAPITAISAANPAVITASNLDQVNIAAGDTIKVAGVADDGTGTSLNGEYTVASVTATTVTTATDTSSGYSAYVSDGYASRVSDTNGDAVPTENVAIYGLNLGTGVVGGNAASMVMIVRGDEPVV